LELASVIIITKNQSSFLNKCLCSILEQTYKNIEIIIVDNGSIDNTKNIIDSNNSRKNIKYFFNDNNIGMAALRNFGILKSRGHYIFFTDSDCLATKNWVEEGMRLLLEFNYAGIEGRTIAENNNFGISNHFVENFTGGQYPTCNMAYKKEILLKCNLFNEKYFLAYEDIDLAIRIKKENEIFFSTNMIVLHQIVPWSTKKIILNAKRAKYKVMLIKEHNYRQLLKFNILEINSLIQLLFPFLLPLYFRIKNLRDIYFLPIFFIRALLHRIIVWKTAIKEKILIF